LIWLVQMADADWIFYSRDTAHYVGLLVRLDHPLQ
jgi:hypothetical protein